MSARCRVRIVVLDGLDWTWCDAHREACPGLWAVADEGCAAPLRACDPPITPTGVGALLAGREVKLAWTNDYYTSSQDLVRTRPWAHELARHDLTVGLVNVPLTWPAFSLPRGSWMVSGFPVGTSGDPGRPWSRPSGLDVLAYPIDAIVCDTGPGGTKDIAGLARAEREIVAWLRTRDRADVEVAWFRSTDGAGHHCWGTADYARAVREATDLLPVLRESCDNMIVVSDHGFDALASPRCEAYRASKHGPPSAAAGLVGGHSEVGVLAACGPAIYARGTLPEQRLVEVAGGMFDVLEVPPPPGMVSVGPAWSRSVGATGARDPAADAIAERMRKLGYL